jgi:copper resistance protein B
MKQWITLLSTLMLSLPAAAMSKDDLVVYSVTMDRLESQDTEEGQPLVWKGGASVGSDIWGLNLTTEGERLNGVTEEGEVQLRVRRALDAFWNLEFGARRDFMPKPERNWAALGLEGMLPYHIETELTAFVGKDGDSALRLEGHHDLLFTQRLILRTTLEMDAYGQDDPERGLGSGLAELEAGLRLRYEVHRQFAPYIGVEYKRIYGETADLAGDDHATYDSVFVGGLRLWY